MRLANRVVLEDAQMGSGRGRVRVPDFSKSTPTCQIPECRRAVSRRQSKRGPSRSPTSRSPAAIKSPRNYLAGPVWRLVQRIAKGRRVESIQACPVGLALHPGRYCMLWSADKRPPGGGLVPRGQGKRGIRLVLPGVARAVECVLWIEASQSQRTARHTSAESLGWDWA